MSLRGEEERRWKNLRKPLATDWNSRLSLQRKHSDESLTPISLCFPFAMHSDSESKYEGRRSRNALYTKNST